MCGEAHFAALDALAAVCTVPATCMELIILTGVVLLCGVEKAARCPLSLLRLAGMLVVVLTEARRCGASCGHLAWDFCFGATILSWAIATSPRWQARGCQIAIRKAESGGVGGIEMK